MCFDYLPDEQVVFRNEAAKNVKIITVDGVIRLRERGQHYNNGVTHAPEASGSTVGIY